MIRVQCRHVALSEIRNLRATDEYSMMVKPLSYEFDLERDAVYGVIGVQTRRGTPWLYVTAVTGELEVQIVPGVLFRFDWWQEVPPDWRVRITRDGDIDLMPTSLAAIDGWFERYVDGDSQIIDIVHREANRCR